jgi:hypothetical protein
MPTKQQYKSTRRKAMEKTNTLAYVNKKLAKGACQQKEDIYTFSTNLILILIPILTSPETKSFNILDIQYSVSFIT